jgi:hypothetical protein
MLEELVKFVTESKGESRDEHARRIQHLKDAFLIRNHPTQEAEERKVTDLKKLMVNPKFVQCELPNYAVHADLKQVLDLVQVAPIDNQGANAGRG